MQTMANVSELTLFAESFYGFMSRFESWSDAKLSRRELRRQVARLSAEAERLKGQARHRYEVALQAVCEALAAFEKHIDALDAHSFKARWTRASRAYEQLVNTLKDSQEASRLKHLKPKNYWRNVFHVANGLLGVVAYALMSQAQATVVIGAVFSLFVLIEAARRTSQRFNHWFVYQVMGKFSRPHEVHNVPSATYYAAALFVGVTVLPKDAMLVGVLVLGLSDPAASVFGKRFPRPKLHGEKSVAGTFAFWAVGTLSTLVLLSLLNVPFSWQGGMFVAACASAGGALAELFADRLDDNFTIPLVVGGLCAVLWPLL